MKIIELSNFKITPLVNTSHRLQISDEEYFGEKYKDHISNSKLKYIDPDDGGSPTIFKKGMTNSYSTSLAIGSAVHELFLQPEDFFLSDVISPGGKLALVIRCIKTNRDDGKSIYDSIISACKEVEYYSNSLTEKRVWSIIEKGLEYYYNFKNIKNNEIVLNNSDRNTCLSCLNSLKSNNAILNLINPDATLHNVDSFNEDAIFLDIKVEYFDQEVILKLKMKADNWTINRDTKTIVLNDLKTSGKPIGGFMSDYGSFNSFKYYRQMALYSWILVQYCKNEFNYDDTWTISSNMMVVETVNSNNSAVFSVSDSNILRGKQDASKLLKMVAYCEMYGYSDDIKFV